MARAPRFNLPPPQEVPNGARKFGAELPPVLAFAPEEFRLQLAHWFRAHARSLPWRGLRDPYAIWLSEIMLQQTRVTTVIERYSEFLTRFPTLQALANAEESDVLALWSGLGYYRRARMLYRGAQFVTRELGGKLPRTAAELRSLPGIGEYTSAAIASIAFGEGVAVVDGNVERVLLRVLGLPEDRSGKGRARVSSVAQSLAPSSVPPRSNDNAPGDHNQAMMELGATICLPRSPLCLQCPVLAYCKTRGEHCTAPRNKPQSRQVAYLLALRKRGASTEVLLERRSGAASLMPGMLELPPLPLEAVLNHEPALRVRHSITDTNYYVEIHAEGAAGVTPHDIDQEGNGDPLADGEVWPATLPTANAIREEIAEKAGEQTAHPQNATPDRFAEWMEDVVQTTSSPALEEASRVPARSDCRGSELRPFNTLRQSVPAADADLQWFSLSAMYGLPLTGLTRKCLQRLRLMPTGKARHG